MILNAGLIAIVAVTTSGGQPTLPAHLQELRDDAALYTAPAWEPADYKTTTPGVQAIFFEGKPYKGKPTRVFAFVGVPKQANGEKVPGMVLMHGGGGTAYEAWVKEWNDRGYAAISIDHFGRVPTGGPLETDAERHEHGGPSGSDMTFHQINDPIYDQWQYHAISDVMLANSLLRSLPGVDADRIGVSGLSWGGYLTCLVASVDDRFVFAAPVYGCGFINESGWENTIRDMADGEKWMQTWDPSIALPFATIPMFWINGTTDGSYFMGSWQKSHRLPKNDRTLSLTIDLPHSNVAGRVMDIIVPYADSKLRGTEALPKVQSVLRLSGTVSVTYEATRPLQRAELIFTRDAGGGPDRKWEAVPATVHADHVSAEVPDGATVYFINLIDPRGVAISTEFETLTP